MPRANDESFQCQFMVFDGSNMHDIAQMVKDYSVPSMGILDENDCGEKFLLSAYSFNEAMEEFPEVGDIYAVHLDTMEIYLYTPAEFEARFKVGE